MMLHLYMYTTQHHCILPAGNRHLDTIHLALNSCIFLRALAPVRKPKVPASGRFVLLQKSTKQSRHSQTLNLVRKQHVVPVAVPTRSFRPARQTRAANQIQQSGSYAVSLNHYCVSNQILAFSLGWADFGD